jgi:hypothetical protein
MTVAQLISELEEYNPDAEVRLAFQPSWPFEYGIGDVVGFDPTEMYRVIHGDFETEGKFEWFVTTDEDEDVVPTDGPFETEDEAHEARVDRLNRDGQLEPVVYIGESTQLGYLPGGASKALSWR